MGTAKLHFASADFTLQAIRLVKAEDADKPIDVTLGPTRLVHARVIEVPKDDPKAYLNWTAYTVDAAGKVAAEWQQWMLPNPNAHDPDHVKRHLDVRLPVGRYKIEFRSATLRRVVDVEVPPGDGPLELPDLTLESLASVRMVGRQAAEIEADDLEGKPVRLADYRGKVVVLDFWATWCGPCIGAMPRLIEIQKRFHDRPVVFLALHDGSLGSAEAYRKAADPLKAHWGGADLPFRVLLDRPPAAPGTRPDSPGPGEKGSGRTAETYEVSSWPSTFVIAPDGRLVGQFDARSPRGCAGGPARPAQVAARRRRRPAGPSRRRSSGTSRSRERSSARTASRSRGRSCRRRRSWSARRGSRPVRTGDFEFTAERILIDHFAMRVEAPGLASKMFTLKATGEVPTPLKLGVGAVVTGRVLRDGKPGRRRLDGTPPGDTRHGQLSWRPRGQDRRPGPVPLRTRLRRPGILCQCGHRQPEDHGAITPRIFRTGADGSTVDLGDFEVKRGRRLAGRVVFADGKAIPAGRRSWPLPRTRRAWSGPRSTPSGRFELLGLPESEVHVWVRFPDIKTWLPPGYRLSSRNKCLDPLNPYRLVGKLDRDVDDLIILFEPGEEPESNYDPGPCEDFKEARSGTIAGAPPGSVPRGMIARTPRRHRPVQRVIAGAFGSSYR